VIFSHQTVLVADLPASWLFDIICKYEINKW
jgi:hypothetical protein